MPSTSALKWTPVATETARRYEGLLSCQHGETSGHYAPGGVPGSPGQAARRMLLAHQEAYGCACTGRWWTYYAPGGAGWVGSDDADDPVAPGAMADLLPAPRWRYHHLIGDADTDRIEKELERLSATGWEVVALAITPSQLAGEAATYVYLLRQPARAP